MKNLDKKLKWWLDEYSKSHQNATNKAIHYLCVPAIVYSLIGILICIPTPHYMPKGLNYCSIAILFSIFYYASLNSRHAAYMTIFFVICYCLNSSVAQFFTQEILLYSCLMMFISAWILQFIGHMIEGKKPSFLLDIQFLLIGPLWIINKMIDKSSD